MTDSTTLWRKSTYSTQGNCIEVADFGETIGVRDSKDPEGPVLHFAPSEIAAFLSGAKAGEFDDFGNS